MASLGGRRAAGRLRRKTLTSSSEPNRPMKLGWRRPGARRSREKSRARKQPFSAMTAAPMGRYSWVPAAQAC